MDVREQETGTGGQASASPEETAGLSLSQLGWRRLRRNRVAMASLVFLALMYVAAAAADFLAPYDETRSNRRAFYHPPTRIRIVDEQGRLTRPYVYRYTLVDRGRRLYAEDREGGRYPIRFFVRRQPRRIIGPLTTSWRLFGVDDPALVYVFGADSQGRDLFSRLLYGARRSLFIALPGIAISLGLGLLYGGVSGYFGGRVDNVMMRLAEIIIAIPSFYLLLALAAVFQNVPSTQRFLYIIVILSLIGWAGTARVIRGMVLSLREREFVEGARAIGCSHWRIITRHILPNTTSHMIVVATLAIPGFILGESGLSFIGLGIQEPTASWGNMLSAGTNLTALRQFPWILVPGVFIFSAVLAWNFVGDGVRDAFDPRGTSGLGG